MTVLYTSRGPVHQFMHKWGQASPAPMEVDWGQAYQEEEIAEGCMPKIFRSDFNFVSYSKAISICPDILTLNILYILNVISVMSDSGMILFDYTFYQLSRNIWV